MNLLARMITVGAIALVPVVVGGPAEADSGPVPEEWGEPTVEFAQLQLTGHEMGRLPGRLGNQHAIDVNTVDEDSVVGGSVLDWWCPAGAIAPHSATEETPCRLKAQYSVDYDWPGTVTQNWSPDLRYLNMRIPIRLVDASGMVIRGNVSIHVRGTGNLSSSWFAGDYLDVLTRQGAQVTGGKFLGRPWLQMASADVVNDEMWLLRYYDPQ